MSKIPNKIKKTIIYDLILIVCFNIILFYIFSKIDFFEFIYSFYLKYERYELDEIIPLSFTISVALIVFIMRRFFELRELLVKTEQLSIRDHLTGLYNRRYMQEMFSFEVKRTKRSRIQFSLIIVDIDDFKKVNDTYGHSVGDTVLSQISSVILSVTRDIDTVARWGGEEFLILCPETHSDEAILVAKRIIKLIDEYSFEKVDHITASLGVVIAEEDETFQSIVNRVDKCLYEAKDSGKNCFIAA